MFRTTAPRAERRAAYIDWTRGIAVLLMIEAHTLDAWTRAASRGSRPFGYAAIAAGFAAPLFLWLAGLAIPLAALSSRRRGLSRRAAAETVCRRGLEIFILAFLFRLQAFVVSPGAHPITLFRVDILNIMGPAIVICGLLSLISESTVILVGAYSAMALAVAMSAPLVRTSEFVSALPIWLQWYVHPAADNTTFTGLPWIGFAFAGGAVGTLIAAARERRDQHTLLAVVGAVGAGLVGVGLFCATLPSIYFDSSFWTTSPTYFAIRVGAMMLALSVLYAVDRATIGGGRIEAVLARFGRSSLFVYWVHVELVYGYLSWPLHRRLPLWGTALAFCVFTTMLYGAVILRDRVAQAWAARKLQTAFQYKAEAV